jgi:hypothetical protein
MYTVDKQLEQTCNKLRKESWINGGVSFRCFFFFFIVCLFSFGRFIVCLLSFDHFIVSFFAWPFSIKWPSEKGKSIKWQSENDRK